MPYLHVLILFIASLLSACSILDVLDLADKKTEVTDYRGTDDIVVGKYGRLGLRDFRSAAKTMATVTNTSGFKHSRLLPRSQELTAFSPTVQVGIYKRANSKCSYLTSVARSTRACRERIAKGGFGIGVTEDRLRECVSAKAINIAFADAFPNLEFSGNIKDDLSPVMRHKIATTMIDNFWGRVAFAPPEREQSIAAVVAFLDDVVDSLLEKRTAYHDRLKKEGIHTEAEIEKELQRWFRQKATTKIHGISVVEDVLNQACTAVLASAPMIFY